MICFVIYEVNSYVRKTKYFWKKIYDILMIWVDFFVWKFSMISADFLDGSGSETLQIII